MSEKIEMATVSSRGQICIPNDIREDMGLREGSKVIFALAGDSLIMKRVSMQTFAEITKPLKDAKKPVWTGKCFVRCSTLSTSLSLIFLSINGMQLCARLDESFPVLSPCRQS